MVTKVEIAKALGVSRTSVTQVLNHTPNARISESTRRSILEQARKMGYKQPARRANQIAVPLISYIVCGVNNITGNYMSYLSTLQKIASQDNRMTIFMTASNEMESIKHALHSIDSVKPLGVILDGRMSDTMLAELDKRDIPFVVSGSNHYAYAPEFAGKVNTVGVDTKGAVREMMRWFHRKGARRISISIGPLDMLIHDMIFQAYKESLAELGLAYDPSLVQIGEESHGREIVQRLGRLGITYDAIILGSADRALRAMPYLRPVEEEGCNQSLVGVHGPVEFVRSFPKDVTICGSSLEEIGNAAYNLLAREVNYSQSKKQNIIVPFRMYEGLSSHLC